MAEPPLATGAIALGFALIHIVGKYMRFLAVTPRSIWLSFAGGVSLAYVFVHLLPELSEHQEDVLLHLGASEASALGMHVYLTALGGVIFFYGLDRLVRQSKRGRHAAPPGQDEHVFWLHLGSYALYSTLIGYLLVHREDATASGLVIYTIAMALHFIVNDQGLRQYHGADYDHFGRWILAATPIAGWTAGQLLDISALTIATLFGFLAGGIVLNVLKEELPEDRESRFWALGLGAAIFALLLLLAR